MNKEEQRQEDMYDDLYRMVVGEAAVLGVSIPELIRILEKGLSKRMVWMICKNCGTGWWEGRPDGWEKTVAGREACCECKAETRYVEMLNEKCEIRELAGIKRSRQLAEDAIKMALKWAGGEKAEKLEHWLGEAIKEIKG